jgi:hypothetical protein
MAGAWMRVRADMAARMRGLMVLTLLIGAFGGVVLATAAGARRTVSSFHRFLDESHAAQIEVGNALSPELIAEVERAPEIEQAAPYTFFLMTPEVTPGKPETIAGIGFAVAPDERWLRIVDRPRVLEGRFPNPDVADEIAVNEAFAHRFKLGPGDRASFRAYTPEQLYTVIFGGANEPPSGPLVTAEVVGIVILPSDLSGLSQDNANGFGTPALYRRYADSVANYGINLAVRTSERNVAPFIHRIGRMAEQAAQAGKDVELFAADRFAGYDTADRAVRVQAIALGIFSGLTALAAVLVLGQAISRRIHLTAVDYPALSALGMSRGQLFVAGLAPVAVAILAGAVLAGAGAIAASPLFPLGFARRAEPHLGFDIDAAALAVACGGFVLAMLARSALTAWRAAASSAAEPRAGTAAIGSAARRAGLPPSVAIGAGMALAPPRGRASVSMRAAMVGAIFALAAMSAGLGIATSIHDLVTTPRLYGMNWDLIINGGEDPASATAIEERLLSEPGIGPVATSFGSNLFIESRLTPAFFVEQKRGNLFFSMIEGVQPRGADEIALGTETMRRLNLRLGDVVTVKGVRLQTESTTPPPDVRMKVVGRVVFPEMDQNPLNDGAAVAVAAKDALATRLEFATLYARFAPGADRAALVERLTEQLGPTNVRTVGRTVTALNLQRVQDLPPQLADLLLLLALATVAHSVVTSVRERRRDIAMLKTLGFVRRQALSVVTAQATTFMTVALVLGIPLGYALGKWSWIALASRIGIVPAPATDAVALALYAAGVLVAANLVAVFPGRAAARSRVSVVLRTE